MINIYNGSILDVEADYIVNPANSFLAHGGGLARVIDEAATTIPDGLTLIEEGLIKQDIDEYIKHRDQDWHVPTGTAIFGPPGALSYGGIIHVVAPIYHDGTKFELQLLEDAFEDIIFIAASNKPDSHIVIPAIGAGIFGNPIKNVAKAFKRAYDCWSYKKYYGQGSVAEITLALIDDEHIKAFKEQFPDIEVKNEIQVA